MELFGTKQPWEEYYVEFDFDPDLSSLDSVEIVDSVDSIVAVDYLTKVDVTSAIIDTGMTVILDKGVCPWVKGGVHNKKYKITTKIIGSLGSHYELEAILPVKEI